MVRNNGANMTIFGKTKGEETPRVFSRRSAATPEKLHLRYLAGRWRFSHNPRCFILLKWKRIRHWCRSLARNLVNRATPSCGIVLQQQCHSPSCGSCHMAKFCFGIPFEVVLLKSIQLDVILTHFNWCSFLIRPFVNWTASATPLVLCSNCWNNSNLKCEAAVLSLRAVGSEPLKMFYWIS